MGTDSREVTDDVLIAAGEWLDEVDVPDDGERIVCEMPTIDYLLRMLSEDNVEGTNPVISVHQKRKQGGR